MSRVMFRHEPKRHAFARRFAASQYRRLAEADDPPFDEREVECSAPADDRTDAAAR
jgi:hypothetical protein